MNFVSILMQNLENPHCCLVSSNSWKTELIYYKEEFNLSKKTPGLYVLTITDKKLILQNVIDQMLITEYIMGENSVSSRFSVSASEGDGYNIITSRWCSEPVRETGTIPSHLDDILEEEIRASKRQTQPQNVWCS